MVANLSNRKFTKSSRLLNQQDYDRVFGQNVFAADSTLVILAARNELPETRLGISVGKKVGNAVCRNRWKRLIRESFRLQKSNLPGGLDIVARPRKGASCKYDAIFQSLRILVEKVDRRLNGKLRK